MTDDNDLKKQLKAARLDAREAEAYSVWLERKLAQAIKTLKAIKLRSGCEDSRMRAIDTLAEIEGDNP